MRYFGVSVTSVVISANETLINQRKYSKSLKNLDACYSYSFMGREFCTLPDYTASRYNKPPYSELKTGRKD